MEEENNGVSVADVFKTILKGKWIALALAVVITIAGTLFVQLYYNKGKQNYVSSFGLTLPGDDGKVVYTYPDGTILHYADIVSYSALEDVKNSDEESFKDVNIEALVNNSAISISRETDDKGSVTYTVTAEAHYFKDYETAKKFITAVANRPVKYLGTIESDYNSYLNLANVATDYESQINFLKSQLNYVLYEFDNLVSNYGGDFSVKGKSLSSYVNEIKAYKEKDRLTTLAVTARTNYYLKDDNNKTEYGIQILELERQLNLAQATLDKLTSVQGGGNITYLDASVIKAQADLVGSLTQQRDDLKNYVDKGTQNAGFALEIAKESAVLEGYTSLLKLAVSEVYEKASAVTFINVNAVSSEGGTGLLTSILVSLVIGLVLGLIAAYIYGKFAPANKKKTQLQTSKEAFSQAQAQAAVTEDEAEDKKE